MPKSNGEKYSTKFVPETKPSVKKISLQTVKNVIHFYVIAYCVYIRGYCTVSIDVNSLVGDGGFC